MAHYPNPFDFVPFPEKPFVQTETAFLASGELWSGYLELTLTALTPVHVVGSQSSTGEGGRYSRIHRQDGLACIPAASIRGCLRAFIEALTAGWVSQATPVYEKAPGKRHIGFATFADHQSRGRSSVYTMKSAIDGAFKPTGSASEDPRLDVASFLFGAMFEPEEGEPKAAHASLARKSRIWVEDAFFAAGQLDDQRFWLPDIDDDAFMGGPKPSASSWWYMKPREFWERQGTTAQGKRYSAMEFVGERYRGRKFYFHQAPERCIRYYDANASAPPPGVEAWSYSPDRPPCKVQLECVAPQSESGAFRVYVDRVPKPLLTLLLVALMPGRHMRHKIGYGKAYGYGSVAFSLVRAMLRPDSLTAGVPSALTDRTEDCRAALPRAWSVESFRAAGVDPQWVDWVALANLAMILHWDDTSTLLFAYPPFTRGYFGSAVSRERFEDVLGTWQDVNAKHKHRAAARAIAHVKTTIHFLEYQVTALGWDTIAKRKP